MNRSSLKKYAPQARREFIQAVTDRASYYGLTKQRTEPVTVQGDTALIGGQAFPKKVAEQRKLLEQRIWRDGFDQTMEHVAYTWFNRLVAIRFMERHGYLQHGYRVLSHPSGGSTPEILEHADSVDLPGLDPQQVIDLKLAGNKDSELYRMLLIAQCNALHSAMPFLFERIGDETELLLPDNLLHSDSLIRTLVSEIPEEDWQEVEIIGWLYQFYISEKKDQVIGKVVKSEDIPAATQLFTPNWIVKYLVQNSLGRQWMETYPNSPLKREMEYYIEPAEQTPEVQEQLKAITPDSLNPEELTLIDPACGSGHILVEAYDLLKAIYQERGYSKKDIPRLILTKNLYGLEIDDRAAQLSAFALMMKARADDRRIFAQCIQPHVFAIRDSKGLDAREITEALTVGSRQKSGGRQEQLTADRILPTSNFSQANIAHLIGLSEHGKTFGSLIQVPENLAEKLPTIAQQLENVLAHGRMFEQATARKLRPLVEQARILADTYDVVITNPPYMGAKYYTPTLKEFVSREYKDARADLYACFMERNRRFVKPAGYHGMINIPNWMFLSSFRELRQSLFQQQAIDTFIHNGRGVFGSDFGSCAFVIRKSHLPEYRGSYRRLFITQGSVSANEDLSARFFTASTYTPSNSDFSLIPGSPIAYWASSTVLNHFATSQSLRDIADCRQGLTTANDGLFLRRWWEVGYGRIGFRQRDRKEAIESTQKWFPLNKGGPYRKWYGNHEYIVDWENDGQSVKNYIIERYPYLNGNPDYVAKNPDYYFRSCITWSRISIAKPSFRLSPTGCVIGDAGPGLFCKPEDELYLLSVLNSDVSVALLEMISPTVHFQIGTIECLPIIAPPIQWKRETSQTLVDLHREDWDSCETSWNFQSLPVLRHQKTTVSEAQATSDTLALSRLSQTRELEETNNRIFIEAYGLQGELASDIPADQITLYRPDHEEDLQRLISYSIGCMMGRYSLDKPGLAYALIGSEGFDPSQYQTFPADSDGIIPITEFAWFEDDSANRLEEFIATAWPQDHLEENLKFIAGSIGQKKSESARDAIRRYLSAGFYKHHLSLYKKRPIYWLFSSGKHRAFQCLVYLHRYNAGTLSRMRTEYVIPLQGKIESRIDQLELDSEAASSTSHQKKLTKERDTLVKHREELQTFDEKLRHYADQRITLDLDDGVKANYGRFGDLLAEVKAITGQKPEE